jgi:L-rhamnose mutarotase
MKVKPDAEGKYLDLEKNVWKPLHQERINQGKITGWILYKVLYTGTNDLYNYVTVTFFDNPANLENPWAGIDPKKVLVGKDVDKAYDETLKSRDLDRSNLIMKQDEATPEGGSVDVKYLEVDFMKVKPGNEVLYLDVEKNIWKPVHTEFIKAGTRAGWSLWSQMYPSGSDNEYQFVTANLFSDFSKIGAANYDDAFKKAHAGKDLDALYEKTGNSRDLVRSELWEVLDVVWK